MLPSSLTYLVIFIRGSYTVLCLLDGEEWFTFRLGTKFRHLTQSFFQFLQGECGWRSLCVLSWSSLDNELHIWDKCLFYIFTLPFSSSLFFLNRLSSFSCLIYSFIIYSFLLKINRLNFELVITVIFGICCDIFYFRNWVSY